MAVSADLGGERGAGPPLPVGSRLPSLVSRVDGGEVRWRDPARGATVAVFLQSGDRDADRRYLDELTAAVPDFALWGGRVIVVMPDATAETAAIPSGGSARSLAVVTETMGEAEHCGVGAGDDAILIADRWGEIYHGARGDSPAVLPGPGEITEWLKFLATQCPECGVPDHP